MTINWSQEIYTKAYRFSAEAHNGQVFPGTNLPYIMHVSFVCMEIIVCLAHDKEVNGDLAIQCALLHDVIEDTEATYEQVKEEFGIKVADGVLALTKNKSLKKEFQMNDSLERIQKQPKEVWMVKLADRITNLAPPPHYWDMKKKKCYQLEALEIHKILSEASNYLTERLFRKINEYEMYF
ncbi:MAG: bifunctional (p)ppGpp synthetase/guanosine-3',5'-bis(diphosphate) 3'-pyrophosphohydrolase [Anaerolineae bacterium]|nr:bifunctional (p)ppGpp synthetase/guanosine-3',5'-bis(diphosphate) 3'-pyrophosphohydrolase [Anaerolineae bacterium]